MSIYLRRLFIIITLLSFSWLLREVPIFARPAIPAQDIYTDDLAQNWSNWSWAAVDLQATSVVNTGNHSISVTFSGWDGLYLHHPGLSTTGFTYLRFFIHGGSMGGQQLTVSAYMDGSDESGPSVAIDPPSANTWREIRIPLADLAAVDVSLNGLVWQGATSAAQSVLYIDEIALISDESPDGPALSAGYLLPRALPADGNTPAIVRLTVDDPQGLSDITRVTLDASVFGRGEIVLQDDGWSNDGAASDGVYGATFTVASGTASGEHMLFVAAEDRAGHQASLPLGAFLVLALSGGGIPDALPQQIGWGSNAWSEQPDQDWQENSGVPWDYVYQYITYSWYQDGWGGNFIGRFVNQAWDKGYVPLLSIYMMLGLPPTCGETATCYASKLQNPTAVSNYLDALQEAARQAQGTNPVIFHLEPDFYGYMQQLSNTTEPPPGILQDDPNSYSVALNVDGYANTLAGFGQRMIDLIHTTAPNVLVAPHASMWATNSNPQSVSASDAISMAQRTVGFIDAMGGERADLLVVEWSDRDAGSGQRPWWDDTDLNLPRPTRAILWENTLSSAADKHLLLWQMPVGNMALDDTCDHYRDNRAAYVFQHPRDLFDAGVFGVLFGGGAECMTNVMTDSGFVAEQGTIAYALPAAPTGLEHSSLVGASVSIHWSENNEPDLWGYQVSYQEAQDGSPTIRDVGRKNSSTIVLPHAGQWRIHVAAYDAMGQMGPASETIIVTGSVITDTQQHVFLPLVIH